VNQQDYCFGGVIAAHTLPIGGGGKLPDHRLQRLKTAEEATQSLQPNNIGFFEGSAWSGGDVLVCAASLALVTGLVEGTVLWALQQFQSENWAIAHIGVSAEILWISPIFNLLLFTSVGLIVLAAARVCRRDATTAAMLIFSSLMFIDWLILPARIGIAGVLSLGIGIAVCTNRLVRQHQFILRLFCRKSLPWLASVTAVLFLVVQIGNWIRERQALAALPPAKTSAPNVLIVVVDTLRSDHLSSYGYKRQTSPNLDRIAGEGVLFESAFSASSWTLPSHASILTGLLPHEHNLRHDTHTLSSSAPLLSEELEKLGYRTAAFSANTQLFSRRQGFGRGFLHFEDYFQCAADMAARTIYGRKINRYLLPYLGFEDMPGRLRAADINAHALQWIDRDHHRPFFVFLNYFDVHDPYLPPQPYRGMFSTIRDPGGLIDSARHAPPKLTPEQLQTEIDAYDAAVAYVDGQLARLFQELKRRGMAQNTLVIVTSDHGESLGDHGLLGHGTSLYRGQLQVPLVFWWPQHIPSGLRISTPVSNRAIAATVMELVDGKTRFEAPSIAGLWNRTGASSQPLPVVSELAENPWATTTDLARSGWLESLIDSQWHYILYQEGGFQLYDWPTDPGELRNMATTSENVVKQLDAELDEWDGPAEGHKQGNDSENGESF
jgi:arylsulfatase A-like enzyme